MQRAGAVTPAGRVRTATVTITGTVDIRSNGDRHYQFRSMKKDTLTLSQAESFEFGEAMARGDHATAIVVVERHASGPQYSGGWDRYDDDNGFHYEDVFDLTVDWR